MAKKVIIYVLVFFIYIGGYFVGLSQRDRSMKLSLLTIEVQRLQKTIEENDRLIIKMEEENLEREMFF